MSCIRTFLFLLPVILFLLPGCSDSDAGRISKVSGKALQRAHQITGEAGDKMGINLRRTERQIEQKLDAVKPAVDGSDLGERVQNRLKWDDLLEDLSLRVRAEKGIVTLSGRVRNEMQRRRAVALAESTKGVEKVVDKLEFVVLEK